MDDPDLPWEPLYPPTGIPLDLAQSLGRMSNPPARSGEQLLEVVMGTARGLATLRPRALATLTMARATDRRVPHEVMPAHECRYAVSIWYERVAAQS